MRPDLLQSDERLLRDCRVDLARGSGPGGQKRNKTSNAVRLTHEPTGVVATAREDRSLRVNKLRALRRLRLKIAAGLREELDPLNSAPPAWLGEYVVDGRLAINPSNPRHAAAGAILLDALLAGHADPARAAANLGVSLRSFLKLLASDSILWNAANALRERYALATLAKP